MDIYVDVFQNTKTKFKVQVFADGVRSGYEVDKLECLVSVMEGLSRGNNLYVDERGVGLALADIINSNGIEYKPLRLQHPVVLTDKAEDLKRALELERARSDYWKRVAHGQSVFVAASPEDLQYIKS